MDNFEYVIIDGYNVINSWQSFKKLTNKSLEFKRLSLISLLEGFSDYYGKQTEIMFDGRDTKESLQNHGNVTILYSNKRETADTLIERRVYKAKKPERILVVTDDRAQQDMIFGFGAFFMGTKEFEKVVFSAIRSLQENISRRR